MKTILLFALLTLSSMAVAQTTIQSSSTAGKQIEKQSSLSEAIKGNWFADDNKNAWEYSIYDSIVIAHNHIYTNEGIKRKGKNIEVTFSDKQTGYKGILSFTPMKSRKFNIAMNNATPQQYTRIQKEKKKISVEEDFQHFFRTDTAYLQGYIDKYNPQSAPQAGLIALTNEITRENHPVAVPILPNGSFRIKLPLNYPTENYLVLGQTYIPFYIEPGQTQTMYIDWESVLEFERRKDPYSSVKNIVYMGASAETSRVLRNLKTALICRYDSLEEVSQKFTLNQFKKEAQTVFKQWDKIGNSLISQYFPSKKIVHLIKNKISLKKGEILLYYTLLRRIHAQGNPSDLSAQIEPDSTYYDFLKSMPMNDETILADNNIRIFMNQFEFITPLHQSNFNLQANSILSIEPVFTQLFGQPNTFIKQFSIVRNLYHLLKKYHDRETAQDFIDLVKAGLTNPTLIAEAQRMIDVIHPTDTTSTYRLPEGKAANIFRNIVKKHTGKVLFIDFWATTCGPCRFGIESISDLQDKYRNHPEFQFIYITSQRESPEKDYNEYVENHLKNEISYRISETEYNYLRELFRFNGIPHCELVEKDGSISKQPLTTFQLKSYLEKRFPN